MIVTAMPLLTDSSALTMTYTLTSDCPTLSAVIDCWGAAMDQQVPAAVFAPGRAPGAEAERRAQHDQRPCSMPRRS